MVEGKFLRCIARIVGTENIITNDPDIVLAETTNYKTAEKIHAIVLPADTIELQECVKEANIHGVQIHPVSRGKNWGYGSRVPVADNSVLLDLSRLNKIHNYDEELAYVTIEPGVTFQQLFDYLRKRNSQLIISTTGGAPDSSVLANALDRGIGTGLYAERFANICGMEVVLPDGNVIQTGMGRFANNNSSELYKWGMGPSIDGLFSQSNLGIVTKASVWLMKSPEYFKLLFYKINDNNKLPALIDALRELAMSGVVRPAITMYNDFRTLSTMVQYPFAHCEPGQTLPDDVIKTLRSLIPISSIVGEWNGEISIRGVSKEHAEIQTKIAEDTIKKLVDEVITVEATKEEIAGLHRLHYETRNIPHDENIIRSFLVRKYIGIPDGTAIKQAYWRKKALAPADMNPDRDKCGMIWVCPVLPFKGRDVLEVNGIIEAIVSKHGFEPSVSLQCLSERAINVIASISWDRELDGEDEKAETCYKELSTTLNEKGYYAYRDTTMGMHLKTADDCDLYMATLNKIKNALDPQNILSTGRYNISG